MLINGYLILPQSLIIMWLAFILLYRHFYNRNINRKLSGGKGMRLGSPSKVSIISLLALLIAYSIFSTIRVSNTERKRIYDSSQFFAISYNAETMEQLDALAYEGLYSHEENPAYMKSEYTQNDFRYTVFTSEIAHDGMHPDQIVYVEYTGDETDAFTIYSSCRFLSPDGDPLSLYAKSVNPDPCFMFMLRYDADCTIQISQTYLKDHEDARAVFEMKPEEREELLENISLIHEVFTLDVTQPY